MIPIIAQTCYDILDPNIHSNASSCYSCLHSFTKSPFVATNIKDGNYIFCNEHSLVTMQMSLCFFGGNFIKMHLESRQVPVPTYQEFSLESE